MKTLCSLCLLTIWGLGCSVGGTNDRTPDQSVALADANTPLLDSGMVPDVGSGQPDGAVEMPIDAGLPTAGDFIVVPIPSSDDFAPFFDRRVVVFGVQVVGTATLSESKLIHAAKVMAEYLDNDEDGFGDDPSVINAMLDANAVLVMAQTPDELENSGLFESPLLFRYGGQDLYGEETNEPGRFDATLEEVLHLISNYGYRTVYPQAFGTEPGTLLTDAMDVARGGRFLIVPDEYPSDAWYTYDDRSCDYECMATEYLYWALTSILGAQVSQARCAEINWEWRLCTRAQVALTDRGVFQLLTDPQYRLPTRLPNGDYRSGMPPGD